MSLLSVWGSLFSPEPFNFVLLRMTSPGLDSGLRKSIEERRNDLLPEAQKFS